MIAAKYKSFWNDLGDLLTRVRYLSCLLVLYRC